MTKFQNEMSRINASKYRQTNYGKVPLQVQLNKLKRDVAQNKRELVRHTIAGTLTPGSSGTILTQISFTGDLKNASSFRDDITGSKWSNVTLDVGCRVPSDYTDFRMMVYVPKKPGQRFSPSVRQWTQNPDPNFAWVLSDQRFTPDTLDNRNFRTTVSLKNMKTIYNDNLTTLERGEVMIAFFHSGSTTPYDYSITGLVRNI